MIAIIDYSVGNLFSLSASLDKMGLPWVITREKSQIESASHVILPGVGAFRDAISQLTQNGLDQIVIEQAQKKPLLGICLGMQLLFDKSYEFGEYDGLGLISGGICPIKEELTTSLKVPHIGWNKLDITQESPLLNYTKNGDFVYFVHSFYAKTDKKHITSTSEYEIPITATVNHGMVYGCQFHPEKSGEVGLNMLKAFYETTPKGGRL
ncbi:MAG: imidazole glycerol phosphate synthase subunit HisH [Eubacteriales bacterium]